MSTTINIENQLCPTCGDTNPCAYAKESWHVKRTELCNPGCLRDDDHISCSCQCHLQCRYCATERPSVFAFVTVGDPMGNSEQVPVHQICLPQYLALQAASDHPIPRVTHFWMKMPAGIRWEKVKAELQDVLLNQEQLADKYPNLKKLLDKFDELRGEATH